jgi:hypothetical protein
VSPSPGEASGRRRAILPAVLDLVVAQDDGIGDGAIDNVIVDSAVHVAVGSLVLVTMTIAAGWLVWLAVTGRVLDRPGRLAIAAAQVVLAVQVLLGIKLLDQGQGIGQLYIHYVGGLIPMGAFLVAGWWIRPDTPGRTRLVAALLAVGWLSAVMAFVIGRQYVNR